MAKKPAPKKSLSKKAPASKKPATKKKAVPLKKAASAKKPVAKKKAAPAKKPTVGKVKAPAKPVTKSVIATPTKRPEPTSVMKPVFETPAQKPVAVAPAVASVASSAPKVVMKAGTGGTTALTVAAQASAGLAANGNTHPANILVLISSGGWPVTELTKDHFTLMEYFEVPGQQSPFSNNITSFRNVGTGAYLLQVKPINGAPWRSGHHLAQILVSSADDRQGQGAVKLIVR